MDGIKTLKSSSDGLTWGEIKEFLNGATPEQLSCKALIWHIDNEECEIKGYKIHELQLAEEDHINPSGDGCEPVSMYEDQDVSDEPIIIKKGTLIGIV